MSEILPPYHTVVIGSGFGGLEATRSLCRIPGMQVTLIDKTNHHLFQPLLYQVASAGLAAPSIAEPVRSLMRRQLQVRTLQAEVHSIDSSSRQIRLDTGALLDYDWLIVATGSTHSYFGNDQWQEHAPGLKTLSDAFIVRGRVIEAFEQAERTNDPVERDSLLTFAVIGAGPTGVEMAGTLAEFAHHTLKGEFRYVDPTQARILLIEGGDRVLQSMPEQLSIRAREQLEKLGVTVMLNTKVSHIDASGLEYRQADAGEDAPPVRIDSRCIIWSAGVAGSALGKSVAASTGAELDRSNRVKVSPTLNAGDDTRVFVIGDLAAAMSYRRNKQPTPVPGVSPAAKQMGHQTALNIERQIKGKEQRPFRYRNYGNLATIGRNAAVVDLPILPGKSLRFSGRLAWQFWLFAHVFFLIGFRNRVVVLIDWAVAYWTHRRQARVVPTLTVTSSLNKPMQPQPELPRDESE